MFAGVVLPTLRSTTSDVAINKNKQQQRNKQIKQNLHKQNVYNNNWFYNNNNNWYYYNNNNNEKTITIIMAICSHRVMHKTNNLTGIKRGVYC